jgi:hypothetical protein|tara:strand:+ start:1601 stop:2110 length:510 start_codon:yes stop_codon:yes gene_type:complete
MEQNLNKKIELKDKLVALYTENKLKIYFIIGILLIIFITIIFININNEKKNNYISEKYVQAGLFLASDNKEKSKDLYKEIIFSKNKFYSTLSLYTLLEKDLETDNNQVLDYFKIVEKLTKSKSQKDLLIFKKALYLIKISNIQEGNDLLTTLVASDSELKNIAEEILSK